MLRFCYVFVGFLLLFVCYLSASVYCLLLLFCYLFNLCCWWSAIVSLRTTNTVIFLNVFVTCLLLVCSCCWLSYILSCFFEQSLLLFLFVLLIFCFVFQLLLLSLCYCIICCWPSDICSTCLLIVCYCLMLFVHCPLWFRFHLFSMLSIVVC